MGLHECHLKPCPACLQDELDRANSTIAELRSLRRRDAGREETALQLITATLEALLAESKRLLTSQGEDKEALPITVPDSPRSKGKSDAELLREVKIRKYPRTMEGLIAAELEALPKQHVLDPRRKYHAGTYVDHSTGRVLFAKEDSYSAPPRVKVDAKEVTKMELDAMIQSVVDSYRPKIEALKREERQISRQIREANSFSHRKSERKSPKPAGKKNAGAPKRKSITKRGKSQNTSKIPARGSLKFTKEAKQLARFQEYEDNHRFLDDLTPSFFSEGTNDE